MINILPINDSEEHVENLTCKCNPRIVIAYNKIIIIHNSFDKREYLEELLIIDLN